MRPSAELLRHQSGKLLNWYRKSALGNGAFFCWRLSRFRWFHGASPGYPVCRKHGSPYAAFRRLPSPLSPIFRHKNPAARCCGVFKQSRITKVSQPVSYPVHRSGGWYLQNGPYRSCSGGPACWFWHRRQSSERLSASRSR